MCPGNWGNSTSHSFQTSSSIACSGCSYDVGRFEISWFSQAYTHVAETVKVIIDKGTNLTEFSTVPGSTFVLPHSAAANALTVSGSVITTTRGENTYTL